MCSNLKSIRDEEICGACLTTIWEELVSKEIGLKAFELLNTFRRISSSLERI
jgi:hypothetical protein